MRIVIGILGLVFMLVGGVVVANVLANESGSPDTNGGSDWSCYAESSGSQSCSYIHNSPQGVTYDLGNLTAGVMIGCTLFISGAMFIAGAVAGSSRRPRTVPASVAPIGGPPFGPNPSNP